jgi:hypothetical protein
MNTTTNDTANPPAPRSLMQAGLIGRIERSASYSFEASNRTQGERSRVLSVDTSCYLSRTRSRLAR